MLTICYLAYYPCGVLPVREHLENSVRLNPHGYGWAIAACGGLGTYKTLDAAQAVDLFMRLRKRYLDGPALFHARYASSGVISRQACHPYRVGSNPQTVIAHNGFLFPVTDEEISDTAVFAARILPAFDVRDCFERQLVEQLMGRSKAVVLQAGMLDGVILNEELGMWRADGSWHSNLDFTGEAHVRSGLCGVCQVPAVSGNLVCAHCAEVGCARRRMLRAHVMAMRENHSG